ncbi:Primosomal protein I [Vibrio cholerae]|nr:Primosomal protein I [Vibrio cholerae]
MRYILNINQPKAIEWGLSLSQAILFDYLLSEASHTTRVTLQETALFKATLRRSSFTNMLTEGVPQSLARTPEVMTVSVSPVVVTSKPKILVDLPLLTRKPNTLKKHLRVLEDAGLIQRTIRNNQLIICITKKGEEWAVQEVSSKGSDLL